MGSVSFTSEDGLVRVPVDGLLGADFFAGLVLTVNYVAGTVDLAEPPPGPHGR